MRVTYISEKTGLHYHTVRHALKPDTNPSYETVKALSDWLESRHHGLSESRE